MASIEGIPPLVFLTHVEVIGDYKLRITFEDGTVGDVSFDGREWTGVFEPFHDPAVFAQVYVDKQFRSLARPNGLDMAPEALYQDACATRSTSPLPPSSSFPSPHRSLRGLDTVDNHRADAADPDRIPSSSSAEHVARAGASSSTFG